MVRMPFQQKLPARLIFSQMDSPMICGGRFGLDRQQARLLMSALLSANEIRLTYGYQTLLDGVTLAVSAGEKTGMVAMMTAAMVGDENFKP